MDNLDWIILETLYAEKSMLQASEKLFISQPAISYRLTKMEEEYGLPLFIRGNKGVRFTDAGLRLYSFHSRVSIMNNEISSYVKLPGNEISGAIRFGSTTTFMAHYLPKQLKLFTDLYPGITIDIELQNTTRLIEQLKSGQLLAAIGRGSAFENWKGKQVTLLSEPLMIIANQPISREYLENTPLIRLYSGDVFSDLDILMEEWISNNLRQAPPNAPVRITGGSQVLINLVKNGLGWAIVIGSKLLGNEAFYNQVLYHPDGTLFDYKTKLMYNPEVEHFDAYRLYLEHLTAYCYSEFGNELT